MVLLRRRAKGAGYPSLAMTAIFAAALLLGQTQPASRFDLGVRLKALEAAWLSSTPQAKGKAVTPITSSVMSFFSGSFGIACQNLDQASAILDGRALSAGDALTFRQDPASVSSEDGIVLQGAWAYAPTEPLDAQKAVIEAEGMRFQATYPSPIKIPLPSSSIVRGEGAVTIKINGRTAKIVADHLPGLDNRLENLKSAESQLTAPLLDLIEAQRTGKAETDVPLSPTLKLAEDLASGNAIPEKVREWPLAKQGRTLFRASFPEKIATDETLVIALHGAGGSENLFYEGYGLGMAVKESLKRGWVFTSPRSAPSAPADVLAWMKSIRNWNPKRVIVMGHSMGGALALQTGALTPKPSALVLFAPAGRSVPPALQDVPLFLAVGRQEIMMLGASAEAIKTQMSAAKGFKHMLVDPCEHLMIVAEALPEAFKWLDQTLNH